MNGYTLLPVFQEDDQQQRGHYEFQALDIDAQQAAEDAALVQEVRDKAPSVSRRGAAIGIGTGAGVVGEVVPAAPGHPHAAAAAALVVIPFHQSNRSFHWVHGILCRGHPKRDRTAYFLENVNFKGNLIR